MKIEVTMMLLIFFCSLEFSLIILHKLISICCKGESWGVDVTLKDIFSRSLICALFQMFHFQWRKFVLLILFIRFSYASAPGIRF
jgi:hypothetical protein